MVHSRRSRRYAPIGKYDVLAHIATGGMGVVYHAVHQETGQIVALKVLTPDFAAKPVLLERFRREASRGLKLRHEHLVTMYEFSEANGMHFLALEFVPGVDLFEYIRQKDKVDVAEACAIVRQVTQALVYLHSEHVVHRDIKPSNVLLKQDTGRLWAKLTDLGLALAVNEDEFRLTRMHATVGTVDYMAPEQARDSGSADIRSDIYSLGCTFFHMLAGRAPFAEGGLTERLLKHVHDDVPDIRKFNPGVPAALNWLIRRMMAKKPKDRYQAPAELLADLEHWQQAADATPPEPLPRKAVEKMEAREAPPPRTEYVAFAPDSPALERVPAEEEESKGELPPDTKHGAMHDSASEASETVEGVTEEQRRAAVGQYQRALQVVASGEADYAIHLLLNCCKLDPGNLRYRKALRKLEKKRFPDPPAAKRWLTGWRASSKLAAAKQARDYLRVFEQGELLIKDNPWDIGTTTIMAEAAEALGLTQLAVWLLAQVWHPDTHTPALDRYLARLYEKQGNFAQASAHWKWVGKADPDDFEVPRKLQELAVRETLVRGKYGEQVDPRDKTE